MRKKIYFKIKKTKEKNKLYFFEILLKFLIRKSRVEKLRRAGWIQHLITNFKPEMYMLL